MIGLPLKQKGNPMKGTLQTKKAPPALAAQTKTVKSTTLNLHSKKMGDPPQFRIGQHQEKTQ